MFFLAIVEFISTFIRLIQDNYTIFRAISAALCVSFPIAIISRLDALVGSVSYTKGRPSSLRERSDRLGKVVNDNFSVAKRILGFLGAVIAFLCIALPWWTYSESGISWLGVLDMKLTIYLYQATMTRHDVFSIVNIWYASVALVLILIGGVLGIIGSFARGAQARNSVTAGGLLTILSVQVFVVGFQYELYNFPPTIIENGVPVTSLPFYSGFAFPFADVTCYLSFGFWFALVAGIIMLVAAARTNPETDPKKPVLPPPA